MRNTGKSCKIVVISVFFREQHLGEDASLFLDSRSVSVYHQKERDPQKSGPH